ncbi:MAG: hypothetical protein ABH950_01880 [Candidatus Altiarchaeota archaeon]
MGKNISWIGALMLILLVISSVNSSEDILRVELTLHRNGLIEVDDEPTTIRGELTNKSIESGPFKVILESRYGQVLFAGSFSTEFLGGDPLQPLPKVKKYLKIPYNPNASYMNFYFQGDRVLQYPLSVLCNNNGTCDHPENQISCPSDCLAQNPDGICLSEANGICDPDCSVSADRDCLTRFCGNGWCERWENNIICLADCPLNKSDKFCVHIRDEVCDPDCALREDPDCFEERCPGGVCGVAEKIQKQKKKEEAIKGLNLNRFLIYVFIGCILFFVFVTYLDRRKSRAEVVEDDSAYATKSWVRMQLEEGKNPDQIKTLLNEQNQNQKIVDEVLNEKEEE